MNQIQHLSLLPLNLSRSVYYEMIKKKTEKIQFETEVEIRWIKILYEIDYWKIDFSDYTVMEYSPDFSMDYCNGTVTFSKSFNLPVTIT